MDTARAASRRTPMWLSIAAILASVAVAAGCGAGKPAVRSASAAASVAVASPAATASSVPSPKPDPTPPPSPSGAALDQFSSQQLFLLAGVREDLRAACTPAVETPNGASAGIQCDVADPIDAIGFYLFGDRAEMNATYTARLAEHDVALGSGDGCGDGRPGEAIDIPGNKGFEQRLGCYVDASGAANVRIVMPSDVAGQSVYVGVNGTTPKILDVIGWLSNTEPGMVGCLYCIDVWAPPAGGG